MQVTLLNSSPTNSRCIIFFNGWGMDCNAIKHIESGEFDSIECHDYSDLSSINFDFTKYSELYVIAWSMGVWVANEVLSKMSLPITKSIAINGTGFPMHNSMGIPNEVFKGTLDSWCETVRTKFNMRMYGGRTEYQNLQNTASVRTIENQRNELQQIYSQISQSLLTSCIHWDCAIIGEQDFIFTAENQKNYWTDKTKWFTLPIPHYPFMRFTRWQEIIECNGIS